MSRPPRPLHVLYGGAHLFSAGAPAKLAALAERSFATFGADGAAFGRAVGAGDPALAADVHARVGAKLARRPIEAMCVDFEDGYGPRADGEEDADATRAGAELARLDADAPAIGLRIKALAPATAARGKRTLGLFLEAYAAAGRPLPHGFTVTLPKATSPAEVGALATALEEHERRLGLAPIAVELMIEAPRALVDARGAVALGGLLEAARGRAVALHLGAYDLTAELGVTAGDQRLDHPYCDFARTLMQVAAAASGVAAVDGATTVLPIAPKDAPGDVARRMVHDAWALHARNVTRAIDFGLWQGWDLHPAQLPARWGALAAYFLARRDALAERLRAFVERATQASRVGQVFDDAATALGLVAFFRRGLACGALDDDDLARTTLSRAELDAGSFAELVQSRRARGAAR